MGKANATDAEIRELIQAGHSNQKIAGMLRVGRERVGRIRKNMQQVAQEEKNLIIERMKNEEIAKNFDDVIDNELKRIILQGSDETILKAVKEYRAGKEEEKAMNVTDKLSQMTFCPGLAIDMEPGEHMVNNQDAAILIWRLDTPEEVAFFLHGNFGLLPLGHPIPRQSLREEDVQALSDDTELKSELAKIIRKYLTK